VQRTRTPSGRSSDATIAAFFKVTEELLADKPFHEITVAEIISRTPHSRSSFYHHFNGKVDVLVALAGTVLANAYRTSGMWDAPPGRERAIAMHGSFAPTLRLWSNHGDVVGAIIEQMHTTPAIAQVWSATFDRFVSAVAEQITHERASGVAPAGSSADMLATVLVCGIERTFYVSSRGVETRLPSTESAVEAIEWLTLAAGPESHPPRRSPRPCSTAPAFTPTRLRQRSCRPCVHCYSNPPSTS
jgi:AcrR family transcriptional regulator